MGKEKRRTRLHKLGYTECPICLHDFDGGPPGDHGSKRSPTVEHAPPRGLRPDKCITVLTCEECNTQAGSGVDKSFVDETREDLPGTIEVAGHVSRVRYRRKRSPWAGANWERDKRRGRPKGEVQHIRLSHPATEEEIEIAEGGDVLPRIVGNAIGRVQMRWKRNKREAEIGLLRAAYLVLYAQLGGIYAKAPATKGIRQQIQAPTARLTKIKRLGVKEEAWQVLLCYLDKAWAWLVVIGFDGVFLPVIGETRWEDREFGPNQLNAVSHSDQIRALHTPFGPKQRRLPLERVVIGNSKHQQAIEQVGVTGWELRVTHKTRERKWISVGGSTEALIMAPVQSNKNAR